MKAGQTLQEYVVTGWVQLEITTKLKAFSKEGAVKKAEALEKEGLNDWDEHNWSSNVTVEKAEVA